MPDATRGFPDSGRPKEDILREIAALKVGDIHGHWSRAFRGPPDVQAVASDDGLTTTLDFGGGDLIVLNGVLVGQLHEDDFLFG